MKFTLPSLAVLSIGFLTGQVSGAACPAGFVMTVYTTVVAADAAAATSTDSVLSTATVVPVAASSPGVFAQSAAAQSAVSDTTTLTSVSTTFQTSSLSSVSSAVPTTMVTSVQPPVNQVASVAPVVSAAAPSSSPAPVQNSVPATTGSKRGLAYNDASLANLFSGSKASWGYNWAQSSGGLSSVFEFVPLLWGNKDGMAASWAGNVAKAKAAGATHLLGLNEPDQPGECDMSVGQAAAFFKQNMTPFAGQFRIGGPAVTNGITRPDNGGPMGVPYLEQFMAACSDCGIDFVVMHWYGPSAEDFMAQVQKIYAAGGNRPVWITEFRVSGDEQAFLDKVIPWLEAQPYVERYAYFGVFQGTMVSGGILSALGSLFGSL